jgi:transcriptional regulator with XRE-family HTH domain
MAKTTHPFRAWREEHKVSREQASAKIARSGESASVGYLELIELGHKRPSYDLAKAMSGVTGGEVTAIALMEFERVEGAA